MTKRGGSRSPDPDRLYFITNNRYAPLPDPQVRIWGVGLLPRRMAGALCCVGSAVTCIIYNVRMLSAREMD